MEEEEESSVSELTEAETVESPGEVADDAGLLKVGYGKGVLVMFVNDFYPAGSSVTRYSSFLPTFFCTIPYELRVCDSVVERNEFFG
jgi:hypothetical protein